MKKKQFLQNWSRQFPNQLQCSSIRINAEQIQNFNTKKSNELNSPTTPAFSNHQRNFSTNQFVGFQNSIQMGGKYSNQNELVKSKSMDKIKDNEASLLKSNNFPLNSLYNTGSFDEMTMKMSTNTKNNTSNYIQQSQLTAEDQFYEKKLQKRQIVQFNDFYPQQEMVIKISSQHINKKQQQSSQSKIPLQKNYILQNMKSSMGSIGDSKDLKRFKEDSFYQEPYFNTIPTFQESHPNYQFKEIDSNKRQSNFFKKTSQPIIKKLKNAKSQSKITLRDYLYLSKLSSVKNQSRFKSDIKSQSKISLDCLSPRKKKKKQPLTNAEIMDQLKLQLCQKIKKVQITMKDTYELISSLNGSQQNVMKLFSLNRLFQDDLMKVNTELQSFIAQNQ